MELLPPLAAIEKWRNKEINGTMLMRQLIAHPKWSVPISEKAMAESLATNALTAVMFNKDPQGVSRLYLFSDAEAYATFCKSASKEPIPPQHFITTTGSTVFNLDLDGKIDELMLDPFSPWDVVYTKKQFGRLRECAQAVAVEQDITGLRAGNAPEGALWRVKNYKSFFVVLVKNADKFVLGLAPDDKGRALAAVFTFEDAMEAYVAEKKQRFPQEELLEQTVPGENLFAMLAPMNLTGIVFNCCGPIKPVAFALPFAALVAEAQPPTASV